MIARPGSPFALAFLGAAFLLVSCDGEPSGGPCPSCPTVEAVPERAEERFEGLSAEVEILRDSQGIPHIYGQTDADVMYASGYMQAHDRLFQMEWRIAIGPWPSRARRSRRTSPSASS
jgi:acyl-homoserine lactone acylase PvdQ